MSNENQTKTGGRSATNAQIDGDCALAVGLSSRTLPSGWQWRPLTQLARLETGHTPSRKHPEYWDGDIPWIGIRDATGNHGRVIYDTEQHVTQAGIDNSSARLLPENTVCLSRTASIGYVIVMGQPMATSQDFVNWVCDPDALDWRYLKYVLLAEKGSYARFAHGTTHQTIYFPEVKAFHVCAPDVAGQKAIADVLMALDDKIEHNRSTAQKLEELARAIFRAWFVDFEPVKAKVQGATSFPSMPQTLFDTLPTRFVDSEIGPVPEGWRVKPLASVATFLNGLALQKYPPKADGSDLPVIKIAQLRKGSTEGAGLANSEIDEKYVVNDRDLLFSWSGTLEAEFWFGGQGALNQHLFKVTSQEFPSWFCFLWIRRHLPWFRQIASSKATTMGHIKREHLKEAKVIVPQQPVIDEADKTIGSLYDLHAQVNIENRKLAQMRDYLLPRLLDGRVRVEVNNG
ncbi:restriction endonuclease subunit S [Thiolapillus sp.]